MGKWWVCEGSFGDLKVGYEMGRDGTEWARRWKSFRPKGDAFFSNCRGFRLRVCQRAVRCDCDGISLVELTVGHKSGYLEACLRKVGR